MINIYNLINTNNYLVNLHLTDQAVAAKHTIKSITK